MGSLLLIGFLSVAGQLDASITLVDTPAPVVLAADAGSSSSSFATASTAPVTLTFDPNAGPDVKQTNQMIAMFKKAVHEQRWFYAAGLLLFVLVFLSKKILLPLFGMTDPAQYDIWLPRISAVLSVAPSLATKLLEPSVDMLDLISTSIGCFVFATGAFKVSKNVMNKVPSIPARTADAKTPVETPAPIEPKKEN